MTDDLIAKPRADAATTNDYAKYLVDLGIELARLRAEIAKLREENESKDATIAVLRSAIDEITLYRYEQLPVDGQRKTLEEARRTAGLKNTGDLLAEIAKLQGAWREIGRLEAEIARLRAENAQLHYEIRRMSNDLTAMDELPFVEDTEVDA